ncbi:MAG: hypothetical protein DRN59_01085, partial [Thaumarchaeota archaeon]
MKEYRKPRSLEVVATAMCAALYAAASYLTAYIPSPLGFGQFRPAVVIPAFFAVVFGSMPAGLGAAIGTLICDSIKHGGLYMGSLIAAVPGNFIGFYIFGAICRRFSWRRFILATFITLTLANFIVAFLYIYVYKFLYLGAFEISFSNLMILTLALTIWWFATMLPFVLTITPLLIRATARVFPALVSESVRDSSLGREFPRLGFALLMIIPGIIFLMLGLLTSFTWFGAFLTSINKLPSADPIKVIFYGCGLGLMAIGAYALTRR